MQTSVTSRRKDLKSRFRTWAEDRLSQALGHFGREIQYAAVRISDDNGPRGGVDQRCSLTVKTRLFGPLTFVNVDSEAHGALSGAIRRARSAIRRRLAVTRKGRRSRS
jgi:hypothetical protein